MELLSTRVVHERYCTILLFPWLCSIFFGGVDKFNDQRFRMSHFLGFSNMVNYHIVFGVKVIIPSSMVILIFNKMKDKMK